MSNSVLFKSSIAKKYFMALTGLFLCTFLIGHLLGNLQLIFNTGEEGRRAFNEYAYFMGHNLFIQVLSYTTYLALIIHAVDGIMLTIQNKKARPVNYAYSNPKANSGTASRNMAILGTLILVFIATHMANFWWKAKITKEIPMHSLVKTVDYPVGQNPATGEMVTKPIEVTYYLQTNGTYQQFKVKDPSTGQEQKLMELKNKHEFYDITSGVKMGEGYKDLHSVVMTFFSKENSSALFGVIFYVISMLVLGYHLWHGFASAFQSLGLNHPLYTPIIKKIGMAFSIIVPFLFAIIPVIIYIYH
ncbi:MAG: succinate dehydrogenase cytochrome b subunit [Crocinitomicaceae bacterium]|jgi:succinate dehydrogenase / fumarate reductase, cytochrome b subunit|nr:succinate dehydrogenase cytochrome b subunit [Crocinitomicaceae bacterium]